MNTKCKAFIALCFLMSVLCHAQPAIRNKTFTRADTLRGSITPGRAWWDVLRYDITVKPDYVTKSTEGKNRITYKALSNVHSSIMQIDLQEPLQIDSILLNNSGQLSFSKEGNAWHVQVPGQKKASVNYVDIFFHGNPRIAARPPWDGGWTFTKDSLGRPWMTVTCQGLGASVWYPCKDHQSDEPDNGASLTMIVPDTLVAVANGRLQLKEMNQDGTATYKWAVINPISNYCIIPYIGKYVNFSETYNGEKGRLDLNYWVMDYNLAIAKSYMPKEVHNMLKSFEYWFGPYPFYEDGYKLIDVPNTGMEHQSAVSYGNWYKPGYRTRDGSGTGWGLKWDFIIVHESGHEWFGNNITTKDLADMWVHEGFTNYSETLYIDYLFGKEAANEYNAGIRRGIRNDKPIIAKYNVNDQGSGDMYPKAGNMLHAIRHSIDNDTLFRNILRGLNKTFYHQTVTSKQIENHISKHAKYDYSKVFDQYLRTTQIPKLEFYFSDDKKKVFYQWSNCVKGFNLPLVLKGNETALKIVPSETWKSIEVKGNEAELFDPVSIVRMYYITATLLSKESQTHNALISDYEKAMVIVPPSSLNLDTFYKKYADAFGIPVVSSEKTPDAALLIARDIVNYMLMKRADVRTELINRKARVLIMAQTEMETDLPERRDWKKPAKDDRRLTPGERENYDKPGGIASMSDGEYWNRRARGMGGTVTSCAEENLLGYPGTRYFGENILVHEFSHNIMGALRNADPGLYAEIGTAYEAAKSKGLYKGQYAINTVAEYWAEGSQWWFWSNFEFYDGQTRVQSPDDLKAYDPTLYAIFERVYPGHHIPADVYYSRNLRSSPRSGR